MAKNEIITKTTLTDLSSSDKIKLTKAIENVSINAINNNTKDFKELCEVAKKELEHYDISDARYEFYKKGLDICEKAVDKAESEEERDKRIQETLEMIEKVDKIEEEKDKNKQEIFEKVVEANKINKQFNWMLLRNIGVAAIIAAGGIKYLGPKAKDFAVKLLDKNKNL